jgi:signal transduction histidine kinase
VHYTRSNGKEGFLNLTVNPFISNSAGQRGILVLGQDVTEQRLLQAQLTQAQKLEAIGQLAAGIAHEINSPAQFIADNINFVQTSFEKLHRIFAQYRHFFDAAKNAPDLSPLAAQVEAAISPARPDYLLAEIPMAVADALEGINRVAAIVTAMKTFSHPGVSEKIPVDINKAIQSTITIARHEWKYVARLQTDFDPHLLSVPCLPGEFNQAMLNIIVNAAHAIAQVAGSHPDEKGLITIATRQVGPWVEIQISDTGAGIPDSIKTKIFDPFFTTKEVGRGTGQGLSIAHAVIVDKHQGTIGFDTQIGHGTTFTIRLPLEVAAAPSLEIEALNDHQD